jgi:hypothetical protein
LGEGDSSFIYFRKPILKNKYKDKLFVFYIEPNVVPRHCYSVFNALGDHILIITFFCPDAIGSMASYLDLLIYDVEKMDIVYTTFEN